MKISDFWHNTKGFRGTHRVAWAILIAVLLGLLATYEAGYFTTDQTTPPATKPTVPPSTSTTPTLPPENVAPDNYPTHHNITATMFWVGEPPDADNQNITNVSSAWVDNWVQEFGGVDTPTARCGYRPCQFTPKENAFYFALPFNDYDNAGNLKPLATLQQVPWYDGPPAQGQSLVKNRWIAIMHKGKTAYAQWEDAGPFGEDDTAYVFGSRPPKVHAGLDVSPAVNDYLGLDGEAIVSWHFVDRIEVPKGPWTTTITTSGLNYN